MAINCAQFSNYLARRTPNFMPEFIKDWHPTDVSNISLYKGKEWKNFTGTEHTRDRIHVAMPNDPGDWEQMRIEDCLTAPCDPANGQVDWGSTRYVFGKFRRAYKTRILCLDQLKHVEQAKEQMQGIWEGLAKVPEHVIADWIKFRQAIGAKQLFICGANQSTMTVTASLFTGGLTTINLANDNNLPTSKLTMPYLQGRTQTLQYNGYFRGKWTPMGKFQLMTDLDSSTELTNANPALSSMYDAADFEKGGKLFAYGVMGGAGNFLFRPQPYPARFVRTSPGILKRVWPFQNVAATVGLKPDLDSQYVNAPYQISVIPHEEARVIYNNSIPSIHPELKFGSRDLWGKWKWIDDAYLVAYDPATGASCAMDNPRKNKGYFLADFEAGIEDVRPELECVILHLRESPAVADLPRAAGDAKSVTLTTQSLLPYNSFCNPNPEFETDLSNPGIQDFGGLTPED